MQEQLFSGGGLSTAAVMDAAPSSPPPPPPSCHPGSVRTQGQAHMRNKQIKIINKCDAYLPSSSYSWYSSVKRVQVVVAMMQDGCGSPECAVRRCGPGRTSGSLVSAHLSDLRTVRLQPRTHSRTHTHTQTERHTRGSDRQLRVSLSLSLSLSLFKYRTASLV